MQKNIKQKRKKIFTQLYNIFSIKYVQKFGLNYYFADIKKISWCNVEIHLNLIKHLTLI